MLNKSSSDWALNDSKRLNAQIFKYLLSRFEALQARLPSQVFVTFFSRHTAKGFHLLKVSHHLLMARTNNHLPEHHSFLMGP